jgi:hypothetical protein
MILRTFSQQIYAMETRCHFCAIIIKFLCCLYVVFVVNCVFLLLITLFLFLICFSVVNRVVPDVNCVFCC